MKNTFFLLDTFEDPLNVKKTGRHAQIVIQLLPIRTAASLSAEEFHVNKELLWFKVDYSHVIGQNGGAHINLTLY